MTVPRGQDEETRNARCPVCGSAHLDRVDVIERTVRRRIEVVVDIGGIYGLRPVSSLPDRPGSSGRRGVAIECADCRWRADGEAGDTGQDPEFQATMRAILAGEAERGCDERA